MERKQIKIFVMDVDGTLTDGKIYMGESGEICKAFCIKDGYGIHDILIPLGILPVIITGRSSKILQRRCRELGIERLYQGVTNKIEVLDSIIEELSCEYENVAYIGDDLNDFECMSVVRKNGGLVGCPSDAARQVIDVSDYVSGFKGGNGAVRSFIEWIVTEHTSVTTGENNG